jgi:UDP-glucose 4-epimerase
VRYLVTGAAGFIGSHITHALAAQRASVRLLDNYSTGRRENVEGLRGHAEFLEGDLRDPATLRDAVREIDVIFHEAAFVSVLQSMQQPQVCFDVNVAGTASLLEEARRAGVKRVVLASSAAVYGDSSQLPSTEEAAGRALSPYAASKRVNEIYGELYSGALGLEVVALRYFNVYGPRQRPDSMYAAAVPIFVRSLLDGKAVTIFGDGGQTRDLVNVADVVRANLLAAENPAAPGQVFNICSGVGTRLLDLLGTLDDILPGSPEPVIAAARPGDIYRSVGSPQKAADLLDFRAQVSLRDGLKETVEWMRA